MVKTLEKVALRGGRLSILGDTQNTTGQGADQRAWVDPALSSGSDWMIFRGPFSRQWFYAPSLYLPLWQNKLLAGNLTPYLLNKWKACNYFHLLRATIFIYLGSAQNVGSKSWL